LSIFLLFSGAESLVKGFFFLYQKSIKKKDKIGENELKGI